MQIRTFTYKKYSLACERNKSPILCQLRQWLEPRSHVLEIGSGTGQHGVFFAQSMPDIIWQCSDATPIAVDHLKAVIQTVERRNLLPPFELDVSGNHWPSNQYKTVFTANTLHIMPWPTVQHFLEHVYQLLLPDGQLIIYGPFRYHGGYTSRSNEIFDQQLKSENSDYGIRDSEKISAILREHFTLQDDIEMPANNQIMLWQLNENGDKRLLRKAKTQ